MSEDNHQQYQDTTSDAVEVEGGESFSYGEGTFVTEQTRGPSRNTMVLVGALVLTGAFAGIMHLRGGPQEAGAVGGPSAATQTVSSFLDNGEQNIEQMQRMLQDTERVVEQFLTYPRVTQVPLDDLQANPFRFRAETEEEADDSADEELRHREEQRLAALKAVQGLNLQSIMHSDARRACMINNTIYQEGQEVNGFVIRSISAASVLVQRDQYRFELRMRQ